MNCYSPSRSVSNRAQKTEVHFLKLLSSAIVLVVTSLGSSYASAQNMTQLGVEWQCVQQRDESFNVLCFPKPTGFGRVALEAPGEFVKTSRPGSRDMRSVAERGLDEVYSSDAWSVPLHSPPRDMVMVRQLLQAVLCNTAPSCSVNYRSN